jgi:hypothetical protein
MGGLTYTHGFVRGSCMAVGMLVVSVAARLAREGSSARPGSSHCCPAKRLHCVWGCYVAIVGRDG